MATTIVGIGGGVGTGIPTHNLSNIVKYASNCRAKDLILESVCLENLIGLIYNKNSNPPKEEVPPPGDGGRRPSDCVEATNLPSPINMDEEIMDGQQTIIEEEYLEQLLVKSGNNRTEHIEGPKPQSKEITNEIKEQISKQSGKDEDSAAKAKSVRGTGGYVEKKEENTRFYVDETEMTERRFLPENNKSLEIKKEGDVFAECILHKNMLESVYEILGIEEQIKKESQELFLKGKLTNYNEKQNILQIARTEWRKHIEESLEAGWRWSNKENKEKERGLNEDESIVLLNESVKKNDEYFTLNMIGIIWAIPIIIEKSGCWIEMGGYPNNNKTEVIWIRQVPDGYLGVRKNVLKVIEYVQKNKMSGTQYENERIVRAESKNSKKITIPKIQEILTNNGIEYSKKLKKQELVKILENNVLWWSMVKDTV